jgi:hypothetical protein
MAGCPAMTSPPHPRYCIDNPLFWSLFLKKLSHTDTHYDAEIIRSLCEATGVPAARVVAKMRTYLHYADPSTAEH